MVLGFYYFLVTVFSILFATTFHHSMTDAVFFIRAIWGGLVIGMLYIWSQDPLCPRPLVWIWKTITWTAFICGGFLFILGLSSRSNK